MKSLTHLFAVALLACLLVPAGVGNAAQELALVKDGVSRAPIVVFANAPPFTMQAANELAEYLEKTSGAHPALIVGEPDPIPENAVWVGYQPRLKELFPNIDFDFQHPEEILILANENHLVIAGRDRWDPEHLVIEGRNYTIEGKQFEYGTANAVYTFIQDYLDVRWLWPGETGEDVLKKKTIAFAPFKYRYHPQIRSRSGLFRLSALGDARGHSHRWVRRQRLQLDSLNQPGGHIFVHWWDKFHDTHPEYFALQPDGTRSGFPSPAKAKLCQANPEVWDMWLKDIVERQLEADPLQRVFNGGANDSWNRGICICERCRAWDNLDAVTTTYAWQGLAQEYVAMSDRYVTFINHLARKLRERFPEKDYYVVMGAYGGASKPAPVAAVPADNTIISSVHCFQRLLGEERKAVMQQFEDWAEIAPHIFWRPNLGGAGWHVALPDCRPRQVIGDIRFVAENHCMGLFFDTIWEHWATHGPHLYMLGRMAWNPYADGEAILADYYQRGFGPAAEQIEAYWVLMEDTRNEMVRKGMNRYDAHKAYTKKVLGKADQLLQPAADKVADQPKYLERVKFVRVGFDYARLLLEARALMAGMEARGGQDPATVKKVEAIWQEIKRLGEDHPLALKSSWISPEARWMKGFHPDNPR